MTDQEVSFYGNAIYFSWIFKPVYGFLSDWFFLCYYRVKGYVVIFALVNIACCLYSIHLLLNIKEGVSDAMPLFGLMTVVYFN